MGRFPGAPDRALMSFLLLAVGAPVFAQPAGPRLAPDVEHALAAVRPQAIRAHMGFLADDLLEGRRTATRGYDLAAKYVAAAFEARGSSRPEAREAISSPSRCCRSPDEPACSLAVLRDGQTTELEYGEDFMVAPCSQRTRPSPPLWSSWDSA